MLQYTEKLFNITKNMKIAVVHDWMFSRRGGEKVLEQILNLFPNADLYYLFGIPEQVLELKNKHHMYSSFLNKVPFISKVYKILLPLLPIAAESFNLQKYDMIISSSSAVAKGIISRPDAIHISYIHSPMRYIWDQEHEYFIKKLSLFSPIELIRRIFLSKLRIWDITSSYRITKMIANSNFVKKRIFFYYGREAQVIYPPVCTNKYFQVARKIKQDKVLLFGAWVPYKKMGIALEYLISKNIKIIAAGHGEELNKLSKTYKNSKNIEFIINPKTEQISTLYENAQVMLFPAVEDFGIIPVEAMATGLRVVAPSRGGTRETIKNIETGFHFEANNLDDMYNKLLLALNKEYTEIEINKIKERSLYFSEEIFIKNFAEMIIKTLEENKYDI